MTIVETPMAARGADLDPLRDQAVLLVQGLVLGLFGGGAPVPAA